MTMTLTHDVDLDTETDEKSLILQRLKPINIRKANDPTKVVNNLSAVALEQLELLLQAFPGFISDRFEDNLVTALRSRQYHSVRNAIEQVNRLIGKLLTSEAQRQRQAEIQAAHERNQARLQASLPRVRPAWLDQK